MTRKSELLRQWVILLGSHAITPIIQLPNRFDGFTLARVAAEVIRRASDGWPPKITFDFVKVSFVEPAGVVFLSNLVHWLREQGTEVGFQNINRPTAALSFLDDSLFFEQHAGAKISPRASPRPTTQPLIRIAHKDSHHWLEAKLVPWIASRLGITEASLSSVSVSLSELFNNIQDHTHYDIGSIFVQHFPNAKKLIISVSDFGLGIPAKVHERLPNLSDAEAIIQACRDGFTTKSIPSNRGAGLDYLLRTIVLSLGGHVTFYSLNGIVRFARVGTEIRPNVLQSAGFCPGTTIDINIRTDRIELLPNEREDLEW